MLATETAWTATVTVRVPHDDDGDLERCARRRLAAGVGECELLGLRGVDPGLSATAVTVAVRVADADPGDLADAPGVERVESVGQE